MSVPPSFYSGPSATPPPPHCTVTATSIACPGFAGSQAFVLVGAYMILGPPDYQLSLGESYSGGAQALTTQKMALRLPDAAAAAFQANFTLLFSGQDTIEPDGGRGMTFVLNAGGNTVTFDQGYAK